MPREDRLAEIKARAQAAIRGPWRWMGNTATDQIYLATTHSGQRTILSPGTRSEEHVYHHGWCESYTLEQARANVINWCPLHSDQEGEIGGRESECRCDELRDFLRGELDPREELHRELDRDPRTAWLTRGVVIRPDLNLGVDGLLKSYREMARYEVLGRSLADRWSGYRTRAEWEAERGAVDGPRGREAGSRTVEQALYREDFVGLAHPEAEFIAHAREDVDWLLAEHAELREALVACYDAMVHRPVDSELFRTAIEVAAEALGAEGDDA